MSICGVILYSVFRIFPHSDWISPFSKWTRIALNTETFHRVLRRPYYSDSTKNEIFALECFQFCLSLGFYLSLNTERSIPVQNEGKLLRYTEDSKEANRNLLLLYKNLNLELIFLIT